ncbi:hypothetical protein B0T25DRAFT_590116 [Lasiosphaeria hispida]|uniref:Fatty acid desaturase domain-containing protein n=1 Tax=Lasiosphaeria hispida TaxID=260671 RepID=A0AAJ0HNE1_9PEZI|nr:hypothetical protein B0T25DRAFT_590116 [Lasiosphaeria hispida]
MGLPALAFHPRLTRPDRLVLQQLGDDLSAVDADAVDPAEPVIAKLQALNDPADARFEPTVFTSYDLDEARALISPGFLRRLFEGYVAWARGVVRVETDAVFVTHLLLYFGTSVPSAVLLFARFSYLHAVLHIALQGSYMGPYTLLKHQHIHQRGVLARRFAVIDELFPYVMDPLMGHTWNSYFYHHVKHHHVEGNGPGDLSSTIRYQRDSLSHFLMYLGRFFFFVWFDLPRYFWRSGRTVLACKAAFWEIGSYVALFAAFKTNAAAATFVFGLPLFFLRIALMVGNWGQHAFVDADEPDSDYRSSVTLVDVASNRFCFNDGYHTSHHLNPLRHWRDHPAAFLSQRADYAAQDALVFHDIDYVFITVRLLQKRYDILARALVPIGARQKAMSLDERAVMLRRHTRQFSEAEVRDKFRTLTAAAKAKMG